MSATLHANLAYGAVNEALQLVRVRLGVALLDILHGAIKTRQRTASSMNFERSPFFMPWEPQKVRSGKSVSFETLMFQRTVSSIKHPGAKDE